MAEYIVTQRQTGEQSWIVEADSKREAIELLRGGEERGMADPVGFEIVGWGAYRAQLVRELDPKPDDAGSGRIEV